MGILARVKISLRQWAEKFERGRQGPSDDASDLALLESVSGEGLAPRTDLHKYPSHVPAGQSLTAAPARNRPAIPVPKADRTGSSLWDSTIRKFGGAVRKPAASKWDSTIKKFGG